MFLILTSIFLFYVNVNNIYIIHTYTYVQYVCYTCAWYLQNVEENVKSLELELSLLHVGAEN